MVGPRWSTPSLYYMLGYMVVGYLNVDSWIIVQDANLPYAMLLDGRLQVDRLLVLLLDGKLLDVRVLDVSILGGSS